MSVPILGQPGGDSDGVEVRELDGSGPQIRLLYCFQCKTIEELPDFEGRPEDDVLLEISVEKHETSGVRHTGHLFKVAVKHWSVESVRKEIIKQIRVGSGGLSEIDASYYDTKSTFAEDALKCYAAHLRPKGQCPDYRSDSKRLVPNTGAERKELGLSPADKGNGPKVYLCSFCPVSVFNAQKQREAKGMYK